MNQLERFMECDMAFHRELARISGNPIFPAIVEALFQWASDYYQPLVRAPGAEQLTLAEHERLLDAIAAHDPDAAERAVREHLTRANELYRRVARD
jgi:DNA-binding FadR family transcriptional regulator